MTRHAASNVALPTRAPSRAPAQGSTTTYSLLRRGSLSRLHDGAADGLATG